MLLFKPNLQTSSVHNIECCRHFHTNCEFSTLNFFFQGSRKGIVIIHIRIVLAFNPSYMINKFEKQNKKPFFNPKKVYILDSDLVWSIWKSVFFNTKLPFEFVSTMCELIKVILLSKTGIKAI